MFFAIPVRNLNIQKVRPTHKLGLTGGEVISSLRMASDMGSNPPGRDRLRRVPERYTCISGKRVFSLSRRS
jgi:hypothetical protein